MSGTLGQTKGGLAALPPTVFFLLCLLASVIRAFISFCIVGVVLAISGAKGESPEIILVLFAAILIDFAGPVILLRKSRQNRQQNLARVETSHPTSTQHGMAQAVPASSPAATISDEMPGRPAKRSSSDQSGSTPFNLPKIIHGKTGPPLSGSSNRKTQVARKFVAVVLAIVGVISVLAFFSGHEDEAPNLKVQSLTSLLRVTNSGTSDVEISDITINDRDDCARATLDDRQPIFGTYDEEGLYYLLLGRNGMHREVYVDKTDFSTQMLHQLWVEHRAADELFRIRSDGKYQTDVCSDEDKRVRTPNRMYERDKCNVWKAVRIGIVPIEKKSIRLRVGDSEMWNASCLESEIVRATITTKNHGSWTYQFAR
jgi:hypothetical protein